MKDTKLVMLLMVLLVVAITISYDAYLESQKQSIIDSFFEGYEEDLTDTELEDIFDEELFDFIEDT
jgi:hypothetical protein